MFRWRSWRGASAWLVLSFAPVTAGAAPVRAGADIAIDASAMSGATADRHQVALGPTETLVLAITVDGRTADEPVMVRRVDGAVSMAAEDLRVLGVPVRAAHGYIALASIRGLAFTVDTARQALDIRTGRPSRIASGSLADVSAAQALTPNGWGMVLNYDITAYKAGAAADAGGSFEGIGYTPDGYAFAGAVALAASGRPSRLSRTDIGYTVSRPDRLLRATIGDFINAASSTSRPVRMAGLKVGTDFSLRPDLVTFPLPRVRTR